MLIPLSKRQNALAESFHFLVSSMLPDAGQPYANIGSEKFHLGEYVYQHYWSSPLEDRENHRHAIVQIAQESNYLFLQTFTHEEYRPLKAELEAKKYFDPALLMSRISHASMPHRIAGRIRMITLAGMMLEYLTTGTAPPAQLFGDVKSTLGITLDIRRQRGLTEPLVCPAFLSPWTTTSEPS